MATASLNVPEERFHPNEKFQFPKTLIGGRQRSCQANWFKDFNWLHYDKRYVKHFNFT